LLILSWKKIAGVVWWWEKNKKPDMTMGVCCFICDLNIEKTSRGYFLDRGDIYIWMVIE